MIVRANTPTIYLKPWFQVLLVPYLPSIFSATLESCYSRPGPLWLFLYSCVFQLDEPNRDIHIKVQDEKLGVGGRESQRILCVLSDLDFQIWDADFWIKIISIEKLCYGVMSRCQHFWVNTAPLYIDLFIFFFFTVHLHEALSIPVSFCPTSIKFLSCVNFTIMMTLFPHELQHVHWRKSSCLFSIHCCLYGKGSYSEGSQMFGRFFLWKSRHDLKQLNLGGVVVAAGMLSRSAATRSVKRDDLIVGFVIVLKILLLVNDLVQFQTPDLYFHHSEFRWLTKEI